uniref:Uncharacterized protein n=1 Tax=Ceratitis capitata TaxID=7213 RepID=W8BJS4_CERCA
MTDMSGNLIFSTANVNVQSAADLLAASGGLIPKREPQSSPMPECNISAQPMDTTPCGTQQQRQHQHQLTQQEQQREQTQRDMDSVFQMLSGDSDVPSTAMSSPLHTGFIDNIDMTSPLQPDTHIDAESVAKTFDIFLEQHHSTPPPPPLVLSQQHQHRQHQSPTHHDMLSKASTSSEKVMSHAVGSPDAKLNHFDEIELFELMSQQLEMDIGGDDASNFPAHITSSGVAGDGIGAVNTVHQEQHLHHSSGDGKCGNGVDSPSSSSSSTSSSSSSSATLNGLRRDMNPSLQPSINELIQQHHHQQQQQQQYHHMQHMSNNNNGSNDNCGRDMLSSTDVDFDAESFVAQLAQVSDQEGLSTNSNNNHSMLSTGMNDMVVAGTPHSNNNNCLNEVGGSGSSGQHNNEPIHTHANDNHFNATPMDVCDDFDNPLGSFSFASFSPDSNINTPPHPFGSGVGGSDSVVSGNAMLNGGCNLSLGIGGGMVSGVCGVGTGSAAGSVGVGLMPLTANSSPSSCGMQANNNSNSMGMGVSEQMSICGLSDGSTMMGLGSMGGMGESVGNAGGSDSFGAAGDILDLFNIDDYKMSWGEGDFAV